MSHRKSLVAIYLVLAAVAGGLLAAAFALAVVPGTGSASERRPSLEHPAAKAVTSAPPRHTTGRALSGFAASFQDYAVTAQAAFGGRKLIVRDCVEGGHGTAFCAYTVQGVCHGAMLTEQPISVKQAGNVGLSALDCTARHALKWIGANG